jgi:hypothetical protein
MECVWDSEYGTGSTTCRRASRAECCARAPICVSVIAPQAAAALLRCRAAIASNTLPKHDRSEIERHFRGREEGSPERVAFRLKVFGSVNWGDGASVGLPLLQCHPYVAAVCLSKSACVVAVASLRKHASPLLI